MGRDTDLGFETAELIGLDNCGIQAEEAHAPNRIYVLISRHIGCFVRSFVSARSYNAEFHKRETTRFFFQVSSVGTVSQTMCLSLRICRMRFRPSSKASIGLFFSTPRDGISRRTSTATCPELFPMNSAKREGRRMHARLVSSLLPLERYGRRIGLQRGPNSLKIRTTG